MAVLRIAHSNRQWLGHFLCCETNSKIYRKNKWTESYDPIQFRLQKNAIFIVLFGYFCQSFYCLKAPKNILKHFLVMLKTFHSPRFLPFSCFDYIRFSNFFLTGNPAAEGTGYLLSTQFQILNLLLF